MLIFFTYATEHDEKFQNHSISNLSNTYNLSSHDYIHSSNEEAESFKAF